MRRILVILLVLPLFIFSCSPAKEDTGSLNNTPANEEEVIAHNSVDTLQLSDTVKNKGMVTMYEILESFRYCKETAENPLQCKYFIAKAIHDYFGIDDFRDGENFLDFENILFVVRSNPQWKSLGLARNQAVLDEAQQLANQGKPVLAIHTGTKFGHVVIVLPGVQEKAVSWNNLNCPTVASFFMIEDVDSFVDKSIAFAWGTPDGIEIFARN